MPRCKFWELTDGVFWQCTKAVRAGFPTCGKHGAGHAKRERQGKRQNPVAAGVAAAVEQGHGIGEAAAARLFGAEDRQDLARLYGAKLAAEDLLDFRPELALARTLLEHFVKKANLDDTIGDFGSDPPILRAIDRLEKIVRMGERLLKLETQMGPVSRAELELMKRGFTLTFARFIPAADVPAAREYFLALTAGVGRSSGEEGEPEGG